MTTDHKTKHSSMCSKICLLALPVLLSTVIPLFAHKWLPFYPPLLEQSVATFYDRVEGLGLTELTANLLETTSKLGLELSVVNNGGHFERHLKSHFFEGWYYKLVSKDQRTTVIAIPCVYYDGKENRETDATEKHLEETESHGFIMVGVVVRSKAGKVIHHNITYTKFDLSNVSIQNSGGRKDQYKFVLAENVFESDRVVLDIPGVVKGSAKLKDVMRYPGTLINPNIMGFFSYIDAAFGMQCVHKVVAIDAEIEGTFDLNIPVSLSTDVGSPSKTASGATPSSKVEAGSEDLIQTTLDLTGGRAYVEGDYGSEFPNKYVWIATNHFASNPGSSLLLR